MRLKNIPGITGCVKLKAPFTGIFSSNTVRYGFYTKGESNSIPSSSPYYSEFRNTDYSTARVYSVKQKEISFFQYELTFVNPPVGRLEPGSNAPYYMIEFYKPTSVYSLIMDGGIVSPGGTTMETWFRQNDRWNYASQANNSGSVSPNSTVPYVSKYWMVTANLYGRTGMTKLNVRLDLRPGSVR